MDISYQNDTVKNCCLDSKVADQHLGPKCSKKLMKVMAIVSAATTLSDIKGVYPKAHWLEGNRFWQVSVPLVDGKSLILEAIEKVSRVWKDHTSILIVEIVDYHK